MNKLAMTSPKSFTTNGERRNGGRLRRQQGLTTVLVAIIVLVLVTLVSVYTSKSVLLEQKMSNNDYRSKQAFETAEAGLSMAIAYINTGADKNEDGVIDPLIDTDGDALGLGDTNTTTLGNNRVVLNATDISGGAFTIIRITSQGWSDDGTATRTLSQVISTLDPMPHMPKSPFTSRGTITVDGAATVHNPEGHSTIWSGSNVELGSNNATATEVADASDPNYPSCMDTSMTCNVVSSSNRTSVGLDVIENDSNLTSLSGDKFFENFFGMTASVFRETMVTKETTGASANADVQLATNEIIWVEGNANLVQNTTVGCATAVSGVQPCAASDQKPTIMVVNGDLNLAGTPTFFGVVFVTGAVNITGSTTVHGAFVASGNVLTKTGGSLDIWYNSDLLEAAKANGPMGNSAGTWKDFL